MIFLSVRSAKHGGTGQVLPWIRRSNLFIKVVRVIKAWSYSSECWEFFELPWRRRWPHPGGETKCVKSGDGWTGRWGWQRLSKYPGYQNKIWPKLGNGACTDLTVVIRLAPRRHARVVDLMITVLTTPIIITMTIPTTATNFKWVRAIAQSRVQWVFEHWGSSSRDKNIIIS